MFLNAVNKFLEQRSAYTAIVSLDCTQRWKASAEMSRGGNHGHLQSFPSGAYGGKNAGIGAAHDREIEAEPQEIGMSAGRYIFNLAHWRLLSVDEVAIQVAVLQIELEANGCPFW